MAKDPDANPLYNKEESPATKAMLDHLEQAGNVYKDRMAVEKGTLVENLDRRMRKADWHYDYTEDPRVWREGRDEIKGIIKDLHTLSQQENGLSQARQLWQTYAQTNAVARPDFLKMHPEHTSEKEIMKATPVLEGTIREQDAPAIKQMLQQEKANGNRFVSFESGHEALSKEHFTSFKSAFTAMEFTYENSTDRDKYIVRSIPVVEKEVDRILEKNKEQLKEQSPGKSIESEREEKRSRSELSR